MYVTLAEYETWLGSPDTEDINRNVLCLEAACDAVREYICQDIDHVTDDEVTVIGSGTEYLLLPQLPVLAVASITDEDAETVEDWTLRDSGILYRREGWRVGHAYTVTYDHGWESVPADIKIATFKLAQSFETSGGTISQETIGGYSVSYSRDGEHPLTPLDRRVVKRTPVP